MLDSTSDDDTLAYVHERRLKIVDHLMVKGVPNDNETLKILLTTLKDIDTQAISKKRIKVEEKTTDLQVQSAALIAKVLGASNKNTNYIIDVSIDVPTLPNTVPEIELVDGEIDLIQVPISYDAFIAEFITNDD